MSEPLTGIRVLEMTLAVQGPAAGVYLRDMGADVIKIEPPVGDPSRYARGAGNETPDGTLGPQFVAVNRGKRSVCVDLSTQLGMQALHGLLGDADVLLSNYRAPALHKLGLDFDSLHARYPRLIYATVNGFGPLGEDADKAMLDGAAVARGGLVSMTGEPDRAPSLPGAIIADTSGAMQLALGVITALFARERNGGIGQHVQTSALGSQLWLQQWEITHAAMTGAKLNRGGNHHSIIRGPYGVYQTACGGAIMLAQTMQQDDWDAFCAFADIPELAFDPRLQTPGQRLGEGLTDGDSEEIRAILTQAFKQKTAAQWDAFLRTQTEMIWERVRDWHELVHDEQSIANGYVAQIEVPGFGPTQTVGNLVKLSATPGTVKGGPPVLGEANAELLREVGLSAAQVAEITAHGDAERAAAFALLLGINGEQDG